MGGRNCIKNDKFNSLNKAVKVRRLTLRAIPKIDMRGNISNIYELRD